MADGSGAGPLAPEAELRAIQEAATELGVTPRALRFYESKGLIDPQRAGTMRVYTRRELARLQLILRGKRSGFSIREIKEFLDLYDADPQHREQTRRLADRCAERIEALGQRRVAIDQMLAELHQIRNEAQARLDAVEGDETD